MADLKTLIIRADADTQMGTGHLMRCLALAQAWNDAGGKVVFITACQNEILLSRIRGENFIISQVSYPYPDTGDWECTRKVLAGYPGVWVVLDGYHFDESYQKAIKGTGHKLLVIDDMAHLKHYYADIVLNQNLHAEHLTYCCEPNTRLLLGTQYTLLRRDFLTWKDRKRDIPEVASRILVTLGGGDPENITFKVIKALMDIDIPGLEVKVIIGASNPHLDLLRAVIGQNHFPIHLIQDANNMPELMAWADIAVSAAGSTVWEMAFMGVPNITLILAENQNLIAKSLDKIGITYNLGMHNGVTEGAIKKALRNLSMSLASRTKMSQKGKQIIDGTGSQRVLAAMTLSIN